MKTTTTTRQYDEEGRLTKEVVVVAETPAAPPLSGSGSHIINARVCICHEPYQSVIPRICPVHTTLFNAPMHYYSPTITSSPSTIGNRSTIVVNGTGCSTTTELAEQIARRTSQGAI